MQIDLSIIIPTFNERENIEILLDRINLLFPDKSKYEIIVVDDDSPDKTWELVNELSSKQNNIHCIHRTKDKGLSSAIITGFLAARGINLAVLDADIQHDETLLPKMLDKMSEYDLVVGSRMVDDGGVSEDWGALRKVISLTATKMAHLILSINVKDPMSGFFMIKNEAFKEIHPKMNPRGFKTLLEILYHLKSDKVLELGYHFRPRIHGESKLTQKVMVDYLLSLYELKFGKIIPVDFIKYCIVGFIGVFVNLGSLSIYSRAGLTDETSLILAIETAIISNCLLNNFWTFSKNKKTGFNLVIAFIKFNAVSMLGAMINYASAIFLKNQFHLSIYAADAAGILLSTIWNYTINKKWIWLN